MTITASLIDMKNNVLGEIHPRPCRHSVKFADKSALADLTTLRYYDGDESIPIECITNDIYLLFNQERLNLLGSDAVNSFLKTLNTSSAPSLTSGLSDDALFQFIKSRHIQSMSELQSWSQYLTDNMADVQREFEASLETIEPSGSESATSVTE